MKVHPYFKHVLRKRPYLKAEWCERILKNPIAREIQEDGRIRLWGIIPEMKGRAKVLRVVLEPDGETVLNAFPDRDFQERRATQNDEENP